MRRVWWIRESSLVLKLVLVYALRKPIIDKGAKPSLDNGKVTRDA
jgi:hypothetical protein